MRVLPSGERAVLVEVDGAEAAHGLAAHVRAVAEETVEEVVPGARTVLIVARHARVLPALRAMLEDAPESAVEASPPAQLSIAVDYDGEDLADVAALTGLTPAEVIRRHCEPVYVVEFVGFAPGFGYLSGLDPALHLPRLDSPRPSVPAGAVAIAGPYSAVYPRSSPGGWRLLGRTDIVLFDIEGDPPSALAAGTRVRFTPR